MTGRATARLDAGPTVDGTAVRRHRLPPALCWFRAGRTVRAPGALERVGVLPFADDELGDERGEREHRLAQCLGVVLAGPEDFQDAEPLGAVQQGYPQSLAVAADDDLGVAVRAAGDRPLQAEAAAVRRSTPTVPEAGFGPILAGPGQSTVWPLEVPDAGLDGGLRAATAPSDRVPGGVERRSSSEVERLLLTMIKWCHFCANLCLGALRWTELHLPTGAVTCRNSA